MGNVTNPEPVASTRVGDNATVIVLGIHYNHGLVCNRKCNMLDEDNKDAVLRSSSSLAQNLQAILMIQ